MAIQKRLLARSAFNGISSALPPPQSPKGVKKYICVLFLSFPPKPESQAPKNFLDPGFHRGYDQKVIFSHIPGFWGKDEGGGPKALAILF
jgi:hypothetical protein